MGLEGSCFTDDSQFAATFFSVFITRLFSVHFSSSQIYKIDDKCCTRDSRLVQPWWMVTNICPVSSGIWPNSWIPHQPTNHPPTTSFMPIFSSSSGATKLRRADFLPYPLLGFFYSNFYCRSGILCCSIFLIPLAPWATILPKVMATERKYYLVRGKWTERQLSPVSALTWYDRMCLHTLRSKCFLPSVQPDSY